MIINKKNIIDTLANEAKDVLDIFTPSITIIANTENVYDVRISLDSKKASPPLLVGLSYDVDAGYFIDIDDATWDFQHNETLFQSEAAKLFEAIRNNKIKIIKKKLFNIITLSHEVYIVK